MRAPLCREIRCFQALFTGLNRGAAQRRHCQTGGEYGEECHRYDLPQILCGSEGTLAVITQVTLRLLPLPPAHKTVVAVFDKVVTSGRRCIRVLTAGILPAKIEMMDNWVIRRIEETTPLGLPLDAGSMLLFEFDGTQSAVDKDVESVILSCQQAGAINVRALKTPAKPLISGRRDGPVFQAIYGASRIFSPKT